MRRPTRDDVARLAGVSGCTVSYVLNGRTDKPVAKATRDRVLAAMETLGYQPNSSARALVTRRTHVISLWTGEFDHYYGFILSNLERHLTDLGYRILLSNIKHPSSDESNWLGAVDGIVAVECLSESDSILNSAIRLNTPLVSLGAYHLKHVDHVGFDLYDASRRAVEHLLSQRCSRVIFTHSPGCDSTEVRRRAYEDVLTDAGMEPESVALGRVGRASAREEVKAYIAGHGCPDGIFCQNDEQALGIYRGIRDLGLRIPEDVALIGCDGLPEVEYIDPPLTTIGVPMADMCRVACEFLERRIADRSVPLQEAMFRPELIIRGSSSRR